MIYKPKFNLFESRISFYGNVPNNFSNDPIVIDQALSEFFHEKINKLKEEDRLKLKRESKLSFRMKRFFKRLCS